MTAPNAQYSRHDEPYAAGLKLAAAGRHAEAISCFEEALGCHPGDARVLFALGRTAQEIGHGEAAESFFRRVLRNEPGRVEALVNLANLLRARTDLAGAIALLKPALERNPEAPELWLAIGTIMREAGDAPRAAIFYREALRLKPGYGEALGNLAELAADAGRSEEALALYDQVIRQSPHHAEARLNRATLLLLTGDLQRGWRDYSYRLKIRGRALGYAHGLPRWPGHALKRTRLLVTAEQGIGDQIAFASLIPELGAWAARAGGRILLEAEPRLVPLFARSFAGVRVHAQDIDARGGAKTARYDWLGEAGGADAAIELGTLPRFLRNRLADFPLPHVYLAADAGERAHWQGWLRAFGPGPYLGLCWRSGKVDGRRAVQYAPHAEWARFATRLPGTLVALQYDARGEEIAEIESLSGRRLALPPNLDQKQELDRTAALIAALDAVISAPTAVSWLAAAQGVPSFKILYNNSWLSFGTDYEPLAPACRCIMPKSSGDWADAFAKTAAALNALPRG